MAENTSYAPSGEFVRNAHVQGTEGYRKLYDQAEADPEKFWGDLAQRELHWFKKWDHVLDSSNAPFFKWFSGAKTNVSYNCLDRHLDGSRRDKPALIWEGEPGDQRIISY